MMMVRKMDRSQWRAVAVPWASNARRMGCEVDSRGGSVVLPSGGLSMASPGRSGGGGREREEAEEEAEEEQEGGGGRANSPTQRIEKIPDHSGSRSLSKGMRGLQEDEASAGG